MRRRLLIAATFAAILSGILAGPAASQTLSHVELHAVQAMTAPNLDGVLDDAVWSGAPMPLDGWVSYNPLRGEPARQRTSVWIAYDNDAIYFAFRCFDEEPSKNSHDDHSAG